MWIVTNKSFLSVVQDRKNPDKMVVRARVKGDLESFFGSDIKVLETDDSDYRFRTFVHRTVLKGKMLEEINSIDYSNFKNSVEDDERYGWYTQIWSVMYRVQENLYGVQKMVGAGTMTKKTLKDLISEANKINFTNWVRPSKEDLALEYKVEYEIKPLKQLTGDAFPTLQSFLRAASKAKVMKVTPSIDRKIEYRSRTTSKSALLSLIRGYASYPEFRNEETIQAIYDGFRSNAPMKMPIVLQFSDGRMRIMGGNTRMDVAQHSGVTPKVLLIDVPEV